MIDELTMHNKDDAKKISSLKLTKQMLVVQNLQDFKWSRILFKYALTIGEGKAQTTLYVKRRWKFSSNLGI